MACNSGLILVAIAGSSTKHNSQNPTVNPHAVRFTFKPSILTCKSVPCLATLAARWVGIDNISRHEDKHALVISCHSIGHDDLAFTVKCVDSLGQYHYCPAPIINYLGSIGHNGSASIVTYVDSTGLVIGPASIVTYVVSTGHKTGPASMVTHIGSTRHKSDPAYIVACIGSTGHKTGPASTVAYVGSVGKHSHLVFVAICCLDAESAASFVRIGRNDIVLGYLCY